MTLRLIAAFTFDPINHFAALSRVGDGYDPRSQDKRGGGDVDEVRVSEEFRDQTVDFDFTRPPANGKKVAH